MGESRNGAYETTVDYPSARAVTLPHVKYTPGGGNRSSILNVPGGAAACTAQCGWYYDDPQSPTQIVLCPATCTVVQGDPEAKIDVLFGCETEVVPPA